MQCAWTSFFVIMQRFEFGFGRSHSVRDEATKKDRFTDGRAERRSAPLSLLQS